MQGTDSNLSKVTAEPWKQAWHAEDRRWNSWKKYAHEILESCDIKQIVVAKGAESPTQLHAFKPPTTPSQRSNKICARLNYAALSTCASCVLFTVGFKRPLFGFPYIFKQAHSIWHNISHVVAEYSKHPCSVSSKGSHARWACSLVALDKDWNRTFYFQRHSSWGTLWARPFWVVLQSKHWQMGTASVFLCMFCWN